MSSSPKRPRIYVAGKMRGLPDFGFPFFDQAKLILEADGWDVVSPADLDRALGFDPAGLDGSDDDIERLNFDTRDAMRRDFAEILTCQALALLPNWRESVGAPKEKIVAEAIGLDIYDIDLDARSIRPYRDDTILSEAGRLVYGDRQRDYGRPTQDFARTALIWTAILGVDVRPDQVPLCMIGVKISREVNRPKRDNLVDLAGYAATLELVREDLGGW